MYKSFRWNKVVYYNFIHILMYMISFQSCRVSCVSAGCCVIRDGGSTAKLKVNDIEQKKETNYSRHNAVVYAILPLAAS